MAVNKNSGLANFQIGGLSRSDIYNKESSQGSGTSKKINDPFEKALKSKASALSDIYEVLTPSKKRLKQNEINDFERSMVIAQALKGTEFEGKYTGKGDLPSAVMQNSVVAQRLKDLGFERKGFVESMSRVGETFYGDQQKAFERYSKGEELQPGDGLAMLLAPLDALDFIVPGLLGKLSKVGITKGVTKVGDVLDNPKYNKIAEIKNLKKTINSAPGMPSLQAVKKAEGGDINKYAEGDVVMSEESQEPRTPDNESMLSKIGNFFIPQAEAGVIDKVPRLFFNWSLVGDAPKTVQNINKATQKQLSGPPTMKPKEMEKRYNIISPDGQKVYQSKSMDDADQKALVLGDQEGSTFKVEEIEVPIKVKKKKESTEITPTFTADSVVKGNQIFYSKLDNTMNPITNNLMYKGQNYSVDSIAWPARQWHDFFRSQGIREPELQDSYVRSYLNKKGGFNNETGQFTNDTPITYEEIAELSNSSPSRFIQSAQYGDDAGNLKYGNSGRQAGYINGSRKENVLWVDSADIRGDTGGLPSKIAGYEGHSSMRQISDDVNFADKKLKGDPYVIAWSLNDDRIGKNALGKKIVVNHASEIQSDFLQKAASVKSQLKADIRALTEVGTENAQVQKLQKQLDNVFRPMPATLAEVRGQIEMLQKSSEVFKNVSKVEIDDVTPAMFKMLEEAGKIRDEALKVMNSTIENIDVTQLFPNIPFKNQKDWVDALIKKDVYEAAKKRFYFDESGQIKINKKAPSHYSVAPVEQVKAANPSRGIRLAPDNERRSGSAVAYDLQYGGPNSVDHLGNKFTSNTEESLRRLAKTKNSQLEIGQIEYSDGPSDAFMIELTPDMLTPYAQYYKDGGLVEKRSTYNPLLSVSDIIGSIGVY